MRICLVKTPGRPRRLSLPYATIEHFRSPRNSDVSRYAQYQGDSTAMPLNSNEHMAK